MTQPVVKIIVDPNPTIVGVNKVNAALNSIGSGFGASAGAVQNQMAQTGGAAQKLAQSLNAANNNAKGASSSLHNVGTAAHGAGGSIAEMAGHLIKTTVALAGLNFLVGGLHELAHAFMENVDVATEVASRLAVVTHGAKDFAAAQAQVVSIATATRQGMGDVAELYQKIGIQADHLGLSQEGVGTATKTFAETLKIAGATTQQAQGSMRQLGEAFDIGKLSGVHYQAMMADNIVFMRLLSQSMGVPIGKMKEMSTQGKVTAQDLKKALTDPKLVASIEQQFGRMPVSFHDVRTAISNDLVELAGQFAGGAGLNTSLAALYAKIAQFGVDAGPAFAKIGVAARAAFSAIAPAASAAIDAIKPVIGFMLDNGPQLVQVVKVAAEAWLAYQAATSLVAAVPIAKAFASQALSIAGVAKSVLTGASSFADLGNALKATSIAQAAFNAIAAINPYVAAATAIAAVVGLLYEFRDAIDLGGGSMATLGDLARAVWADIKTGVSVAASVIEDTFGGAWDAVKSGVNSLANFLGPVFTVPLNFIKSLWHSAFGDLSLDLAGLLTGAARVADGMVGVFKGTVNTIVSLFRDVPGLILHGDWAKIGSTLATNFASGFGHTAEDAVKGLIKQAGDIGAARRAAAKHGAVAAPAALPTPKGLEGGDDGSDDDKAKKAAEARNKKIREYWQTLQNALDTSKLLPLEAEKLAKWQELQKIYGDKLSAGDKQALEDAKAKIAAKLQEIAVNKALVGMEEETRQTNNANLINATKKLGVSESEQKIQDALAQRQVDALNAGATIADLASAAWQADQKRLEAALRTKQAYDDQAAAIAKVGDIAAKYSPTADRAKRLADIATDRTDFTKVGPDGKTAADTKGLSKDVQASVLRGMDDATRAINNEWRDQFSQTITDLADSFHGKFGDAIKGVAGALTALSNASKGQFGGGLIGGLSNLLGKNADGTSNAIGDQIAKSNAATFDQLSGKSPIVGLSKSFSGFKDTVSGLFGSHGDFTKSMGSILGSLGAGAQIGDATSSLANPLLKAIGLKTSKTGSEVGGALGNAAFGPIGAIAGSIIGSVIGGLFKKTPKASSTIGYTADGQLGVISTTGNNAKAKAASSQAGGAVASGLQSIADALGGSLDGNASVSIGTKNGKYRVDTTGQGRTKGSGVVDFGKDGEEAAVQYAIEDALKDGVLTGISDFSKRALAAATDLDYATKIAANYETLLTNLKALDNPIAGAVDAITKPIDSLRASMVKMGATTADLNNVDKYRTEVLEKAKVEQLKTLTDLQDALKGDDSGVSKLDQLTAAEGKLSAMEATLSSGGTVDQDDFSDVVNKIQGLAGDIYGTSTEQAQELFARLAADTQKAIDNAGSAFDAAANGTDAAAQTAVLTSTLTQATLQTDYLRQLVEAVTGGSTSTGGGSSNTVNGKSVLSY